MYNAGSFNWRRCCDGETGVVKNFSGLNIGKDRVPSSDQIFKDMKNQKTNSDPPVINVNDMNPVNYAGQTGSSPFENTIYDGSKFYGGFGNTQILQLDYWTLRQRSGQLFNENLYARGIIRRLVTNEINTGLSPECSPDEEIIGVEEDSLNDWTETVENRFNLWAKNPAVCDWNRKDTFGAIQRAARMEALISGDVLVVLRFSRKTKVPMVQLISGNSVRTPLMNNSGKLQKGHKITHGIEFDKNDRQVAFWIDQKSGGSKRLPAFGEKSGRRISWMVYGTEKRLDEVRGTPLLSLVLQSLKEVDRYRDAAQRKAVINSILALFIQKKSDKMGTLPMTGGAVRKDSATVTDGDGTTRKFDIASQIPGMVIEELQEGEEPKGFGNDGTDQAFGEFEASIIQAIAWANQIPPEILTLAFSNNYSASQAAINEFKIYLNLVWGSFGESFCSPIQVEWLINEVLLEKIEAPGLLEAWRDKTQYDIFGAWTSCDWYGSIKPSTDMLKQAKGSKMLVEEGWSTNARESRITTGTKFSKNIKRLKRENEQKVEAMRPIAEFKKEFDSVEVDKITNLNKNSLEDINEMLEELVNKNEDGG